MLPIINVWAKAVKKKSDGVKTIHPGFSCALKTSRRPQYYMYNIVMLLVSRELLWAYIICIQYTGSSSTLPCRLNLRAYSAI